MRVKYTIHRKSAMVGKVEEVSDRLGERLLSSGHAVRADEGPAARPVAPAARPAARPVPSAQDSAE